MKRRTFLIFIAPSVLLMTLFIALPLVSVLWQSFNVTRAVLETKVVEICTPGFGTLTCVSEERTQPVLDEDGNPILETTFAGLDVYRSVINVEAVNDAFEFGDAVLSDILQINFFKALRFTVTFTLFTLPLVIIMGLLIASAVNNIAEKYRGMSIFVSLLPFIITPVIGALSIRWLLIGDGILTKALEQLLRTDLALFANPWTLEAMMLFYRVWHVAPFAFVIFYAGLQTVNNDTLESAVIDGASPLQRYRYVVLPHLAPLIIFVSLIHLMDSYRVFEEVIGFSSQAHVISLQWLTYDYLIPNDAGDRLVSSASATSMLTMVGIAILLIPVLIRTWHDHREGGH
ncbi:MAG: sugar ABC transporter permease [Alphaproteobacteria bacterium]|nr:sugar ABC transporter permease [Alphaproteobacteria bacterium]